MTEQPAAQLWRYDINMTDGTHQQRCLAERQFDFPSVHPALSGWPQANPLHDEVAKGGNSCCMRVRIFVARVVSQLC